MPDHRLFDLGQRVQDAVELPDFESLRGRGRRLVRTRVIAAAFAVAVVATAGVGGATSGLVDSDLGVADVPLRDFTPADVVQHSGAELESFAVDPDNHDVRAAVWQLPCEAVSDDDTGRRCDWSRQALAVSDDGFASAAYVPLPDNNRSAPQQLFGVQAVGSDHFYVGPSYRDRDYIAHPYRDGWIVDTQGSLTRVTVAKEPTPLADDEILLEQDFFDRRGTYSLGLDPDAARAHPLETPGGHGRDWQSPDGTLWDHDPNVKGAKVTHEVASSTDGGATWSQPRVVPIQGGGWDEIRWLPSAADRTGALVRADELLDPVSLVRSTDGGRTWDKVGGPPDIDAHWIVVRPDGSLLMQGNDGRTYASDGTDWTVATPVEPGLPDSVEWEYGYPTHAQSVVDADGNQTVYVVGDTDQAVWASTDGSHWEETPAR